MTIAQTTTVSFELPREYKKWQEFLTNIKDKVKLLRRAEK